MLKVAKEKERFMVSLNHVNKINTLFSELIRDQLSDLVSVPGRHVVFNLAGIRFIDSSGFSTLQLAAEISQAKGSRFQLCNVGDEVQELMSETNVYNGFEILPSPEARE
ncbi:MAG: STAS domain-containing protein [Bacteroidales bacterium]